MGLSKIVNLSVQTISGLENGKVGTRTTTAERLAAALNCTPAELLSAPDQDSTDLEIAGRSVKESEPTS